MLELGLIPLIGRFYLQLRFRNELARKEVLEKEFGGDYHAAGTIALLQLTIALFVLGVIALIAVSVYASLTKPA